MNTSKFFLVPLKWQEQLLYARYVKSLFYFMNLASSLPSSLEKLFGLAGRVATFGYSFTWNWNYAYSYLKMYNFRYMGHTSQQIFLCKIIFNFFMEKSQLISEKPDGKIFETIIKKYFWKISSCTIF